MKQAETISVLMSCFNGAQWIEEAIVSVLNQSHPIDEFIIVDVPSATARKIELDLNKEMSLYFSKEDARIYST